jgi:hypothetical protein
MNHLFLRLLDITKCRAVDFFRSAPIGFDPVVTCPFTTATTVARVGILHFPEDGARATKREKIALNHFDVTIIPSSFADAVLCTVRESVHSCLENIKLNF